MLLIILVTFDTWCRSVSRMRQCAGGGDTDTVAAMTGALCGALRGTHWIPQQW